MPEENRAFIPLIIQRLYSPSINNYSSELLAFSSNSVLWVSSVVSSDILAIILFPFIRLVLSALFLSLI